MNSKLDHERWLQDFLTDHPRISVLTGAGISLAGGIPTYRDAAGTWQHSEPVQHQEFLHEAGRRQRYWARSMRGWPPVRDAQPTAAHAALAALERRGHIELLITQNVDRLHQRAGSKRVVDLHGRLDQVICLDCGRTHCRNRVQEQLIHDNPQHCTAAIPRPDGDADLPEAVERRFVVPTCPDCSGTLMPDVVFFGGTVPGARVQACMDAVERADALLVVGSSLQVFSGFRFCRYASELGRPIAILNPGKTRGDGLADLKLESDCQALLQAVR
ncbi:NAD-dependent protein deacetylase [Pseudohalioglobus lutimaris]|uniref:protein acetyllysine N-acetyltransferase n=1 Tax=Pseudohalioglobus lutimaris TaxID=1737061 RepID=A0A2N5X8C9_9GAMM|nr:NAD-dependent protein deacetylase [Pseudohalioglobus lutimaris]PLW70719.1 NAD-dependent protein deacetylase [Pseudohalioglobus lutimaris]